MATKQVIPSKDALRALRGLAFPAAAQSSCQIAKGRHPTTHTRSNSTGCGRGLDRASFSSTWRRKICGSKRYTSSIASTPNDRELEYFEAFNIPRIDVAKEVSTQRKGRRLSKEKSVTPLVTAPDAKSVTPTTALLSGVNKWPSLIKWKADYWPLDDASFYIDLQGANSSDQSNPSEPDPDYAQTGFSPLSRQQSILDKIYSRVRHAKYHRGDEVAAILLGNTMEDYAATGKSDDWHFAQVLFLHCCPYLSPTYAARVRGSFVRSQLKQLPPRLSVLSLLVPDYNAVHELGEQDFPKVVSYLSYFCSECSYDESPVQETRKILQGLQSLSLRPTMHVLIPMFRHLVQRCGIDVAEHQTRQLAKDFDIPIHPVLYFALVRALGVGPDWSAVDRLFVEMHEMGWSRSKPYQVATLFTVAYRLLENTILDSEQLYDFALYNIRSNGVIPTSRLSGCLLRSFGARRRYDLVAKFMEYRQEHFPSLRNLAHVPRAAFDIYSGWTTKGYHSPTCASLFALCKAIAYSRVRLVFSSEFRFLVTSLAKLRLIRLTVNYGGLVGFKRVSVALTPYQLYEQTGAIETVFQEADAVLAFGVNHPSSAIAITLSRSTLENELREARRLLLLISDYKSYIWQYGIPQPPQYRLLDVDRAGEDLVALPSIVTMYSRHNRNQKEASHNSPPVDQDEIRRGGMPLPQLISDLEEAYQTVDNVAFWTLLKSTVRGLKKFARDVDLSTLLMHLYLSRKNKSLLRSEVIETWLDTALATFYYESISCAMWAIVDSPDAIPVSPRTVVLIKLIHRHLQSQEQDESQTKAALNQMQEIEYLRQRIYRRVWYQIGCPAPCDVHDDEDLRSWVATTVAENNSMFSKPKKPTDPRPQGGEAADDDAEPIEAARFTIRGAEYHPLI